MEMETPWQLTWVCGRQVPRWIVEAAAGQRVKRARLAFVETPPLEVERVSLEIAERLGPGWRVQLDVIRTDDLAAASRCSADLVWARGALSQLASEERVRVVSALGASLAPGGCFVVDPAEKAAPGADLSPCSAPGVFLKDG